MIGGSDDCGCCGCCGCYCGMMHDDAKSFTSWWQLKYFLLSPLPGEIIQFD